MTDVRVLGDEDFEAWAEVYLASFDRDVDAPWSAAEKRVNLADDAYGTKLAWAAWHGDEIVGGATAVLPLKDNVELAYIEVFVRPDDRRRGHGTGLLQAVADAVRERGRTRLFGEALWPADQDTDSGREFALAHGFGLDLLDVVRRLDLPTTPPDAPFADGYTALTWRDACPDELVDQYAGLRQRMNAEAPNGEQGLEAEFWDAERIRRDEADAARQGRTMQVTVAVAPDGRLAGHTQLSFPDASPAVYQWDTLVLPEHRGHGLGLSLKAHTMRVSDDLLAGRTHVLTYNAEVNAHMIAVNETLGFRPVAYSGEFVRAV